MPKGNKVAPPQQSKLEEMWGGKKKTLTTKADKPSEASGKQGE